MLSQEKMSFEAISEALQAMGCSFSWIHRDEVEVSEFVTRDMSDERKRTWSAGRVVLKDVMDQLGLEDDPWALNLPHPYLSLSHSCQFAVAIGQKGVGIGVDLEKKRKMPSKISRYFENDNIDDYLLGWTIKEAVIKAHAVGPQLKLKEIKIVSEKLALSRGHRFDLTLFNLGHSYLTVAIKNG